MHATPKLSTARAETTRRLEHLLELPMAVLGILWLLLLVVDLLGRATSWTEMLTTAIWIVFVAEFGLRLLLAPRKRHFLSRHWLTALSLALPALRVFRFARAVRLLRAGRSLRALRLARLLTSFNRGMRTLGSTIGSRGFPYVVLLTTIVLILGAAGMYTFEREDARHEGFSSFGAALWWTAMLLTTMGSEYWPRTSEGRFVCLLLSIYAFAVFGYITATLSSWFIGSDTAEDRQRSAKLETELAQLRLAIERMTEDR